MASENDATINRLREIAMSQPQIAQAHVRVIAALVNAETSPEAVDYLVHLVNAHPTWPQLHFDVLSLLYRGDPLSIGPFFEDCLEASKAQPNNNVMMYVAAVCKHARGVPVMGLGLSPKQVAETLAMYDRTIELDPKFAAAYFHAGIAAYSLSDFDRAAALALQAITIERRMAEPYLLLATIHKRYGQNAEAVKLFQLFIELADQYLAQYAQSAKAAIAMLKV